MNTTKTVKLTIIYTLVIIVCYIAISCSITPKRGTELQYYTYNKQEVKVDGNSIRFLTSKIFFNEYLLSYYSNIENDQANFYYNLGVSFKWGNNSEQPVKIIIYSAFIKYPESGAVQKIELVNQETELHYGRYYTPIGALVIPRSNESKAVVEVMISVFEKENNPILVNKKIIIYLKQAETGYEIDKTEIVD